LKRVMILMALMSVGAGAVAQPYFVRGSFNGWTNSTDPMIDMGGGRWSYIVSGLSAGASYQFKATTDDWSFNAPGSNIEAVANANGQIVVNFFPNTTWSDGWSPDGVARAGYEDTGHGWEVVGSFPGSNWSDPLVTLTNMGGGLFRGEAFVPVSGSDPWEFKFRKINDWGANVGADFGNGQNILLNVTDPNLPILFQLDLPNGRWSAEPVPEPGTLLALGAGAALMARRRRKQA
jgi:hypothetical protein